MENNYFKQLYNIDVRDKTREKNNLSYISWSSSWSEIKSLFPDSTFNIYEHDMKITETKDDVTIERVVGRPWFDDGKTGWVKTGMTINGIEHTDSFPILDFKNKPIPAANITSYDANKSIQRSLVRCGAKHGLALYLYMNESLPEELKEITDLQAEIMEIMKKKCALSDAAKEKVAKICKEADPDANGDPRLIEDLDTLKALKKSLMAVRK